MIQKKRQRIQSLNNIANQAANKYDKKHTIITLK
jgi:hypothetical protein